MNTLLTNAISAVRLGVEDYQSPDRARLTSAVRNITAGVLLLFKEKLRRLSPPSSDEVLLKERLRPTLSSTGQLTFIGAGRKTVDVQQIKDRFEALGVSVDWKRFDQLVRFRNDLEHYYTTAAPAAVQGALADTFAVLRSFVTVELEAEPLDLLGVATWHFLLEQSTVFEAQLAACRADLDKIDWPDAVYADIASELRCVHCHSELVKPVETDVEYLQSLEFLCTSCGEVSEFDDVVGEAISEAFAGEAYIAMTDGGDPPIVDCHDCGQHAFHVETGACLLCRGTLQHTECAFCGESLGPDDQDNGGLCGYHKWQVEKDA
ncbi:hypothetical protein FYM52_06950 [Comamonas sp. CAH-2]|uniref:hypothetical protein n=1 Tax=Comamonas sp. CAH-2 TaxID=2605745 RepID=UPI0012AE3F48|nr:hypothetical protein [Comamonas sp. CAH-2]MRT20082.1 hypothetical protein [Comamonas sp. CAH-2]